MIRNLIIMAASGVVIFEKIWVDADSKQSEKGRLFGSLITTMSEFSRQSTGGMMVSYLEFNEVAISIVENPKSKLICTLFHDVDDGADFGQTIAYCILKSFVESYHGELSNFGANLNTGAFTAFGTKLLDAIRNSVKAVTEQLQEHKGISNALVVFDDGSAVSATNSDEDNFGLVANLIPILSLSNDLMQSSRDTVNSINMEMSRQSVLIERIPGMGAALVCVCKNRVTSNSYQPAIKRSLNMLQRIFQTSQSLSSTGKF
eukprot:TRINITY_DN3151_c0_g1_i1.p1 TRINITY_DN3151_c0_g1~~TRINITY_DN3151_c0_g1_i1.p1  ORF type:complete len:260 (-),score=67.63 TRINITY_DN3151_c0_g1_i1:48-827(-)